MGNLRKHKYIYVLRHIITNSQTMCISLSINIRNVTHF